MLVHNSVIKHDGSKTETSLGSKGARNFVIFHVEWIV